MTHDRDTARRAPMLDAPSDHEDLIGFLERDQLVADTSRPVPKAVLPARVRGALWALRVFAVLVSLLVIYTVLQRL